MSTGNCNTVIGERTGPAYAALPTCPEGSLTDHPLPRPPQLQRRVRNGGIQPTLGRWKKKILLQSLALRTGAGRARSAGRRLVVAEAALAELCHLRQLTGVNC